jgi:hypothetical protein
MGSDLSAAGFGWLAAASGGFALGAAIAWVLKAFAARRRHAFRESRRDVSWILVCVSAMVAAGAALLIFPPKSLLADASLWFWAGAWTPAGLLCVLFPLWAGAPIVVLVAATFGFTASEAASWHALEPGREVARFVPFDVGDSGSRGDLSVPNRNAVPVLSEIKLAARVCALEARVLEFSGPFTHFFGKRRYILARMVDGSGAELHRFPEKHGLLGLLFRDREMKGLWMSAVKVRSAVRPLAELEPLSWAFDSSGRLAALDNLHP